MGGYLLGRPPSERLCAEYLKPRAVLCVGDPVDSFDRFLLRWSLLGTTATRGADLYLRFLRPNAWLRRKLVVLLALAEVLDTDTKVFRGPVSSGLAAFCVGVGVRGLLSVAALLLSAPVLLIAHLLLRGRQVA